MAVCRACKQLIEDTRVLCPHCYAPLRRTESGARSPRAVLAVLVILAAVAMAVRLIVYRFF